MQGLVSAFPRTRPGSYRSRFDSKVSSKNKNPVKIPTTKKQAEARFGNANGYRLRNSIPPNKPGCFSAGRAKAPPNAGPKILPIVQTSGIKLNARGCSSRWGTISATMVRRIPTLPFISPTSAREISTIVSVRDMPSMMEMSIVQISPDRMMGLRPT